MSGSPNSEIRFRHSTRPSAEAPFLRSEATPGPDHVDTTQLWSAIQAEYPFILKVALLVGCAVMLFTFASRMTFQASGRLYLGEVEGRAKSGAAAPNDLALAGNDQSQVGSEIEILRSQSLVTRAVLESGLNAAITREGESTPRYLQWLLARRDPRLVDGALEEVSAVNATFVDRSLRRPREYSVRFDNDGAYHVFWKDHALGRGLLGEPFKTAEVAWTLMRGSQRTPRAGARYLIEVRPLDRVVDDTLDILQITAPKQSSTGELVNVLTLEFRDASPHYAAAFLERLMRAYLAERQSWKTEDATAAEAFVGEQLGGMKRSLDGVQQKLAEYRTNNEVVVLGKEAEAMIEQIGKYEEQRLAARLQVAALVDVKRALASRNPPPGAFLMGEANDTVLEGMGNSLTEARAKLADLETRFSDAAPDVREQRARVDAQLASIRSYVNSRSARAQDNLGSLSSLIQQLKDKLKTVPGAELGLAQLSRESEVYSKTYSYLLERQQQAAIVKASTLSKNRVLDMPEVPLREASPRLLLRLASLVAGLLIGTGLVVLRSLASGNFQGAGDVQRGACGVPVFGTIPLRRSRKAKAVGSEADGLFQALIETPNSDFSEAFRVLQASLRHWADGGRGGALLVTSPRSGDGKTTIVLSLATILAAEGKRVLIIDADMTRAAATANERSLAGFLEGKRRWRDTVFRLSLPYGEASIIHSGGPTTVEGHSYERRQRLLEDARQSFDFVLIDSPSFPPVADALSWADLADGVISVVRVKHTPRKLALEHLSRLSAFARAFAIVVNDAGPVGRDRVAVTIETDPSNTLADTQETSPRAAASNGSSRAPDLSTPEPILVQPRAEHRRAKTSNA